MGCEANVVKVYDSFFHSVDHTTEKVIVNLFQYTDTKLTIKMGDFRSKRAQMTAASLLKPMQQL